MFTRIFLLFLNVVMIYSVEIDFNFQDKVPEGERRYSELLKKVESYGDCWKKAMSDLHIGCKRLTEEVQGRLALSFTNCFLKHTGSDLCSCSSDVPISNCLRNSSDRVYNTYIEFFTHTQSICHYLQHREWQEEAAKTVLILTETSEVVSKKLDESAKSQSKILDLQQASVYEQKRFISHSKILNAELQKSRDNARDVYNEFKVTSNEQRLLLFEVFDRVKNLQHFVLGEFTGVYTVVYFFLAVILIYILTSVPRTAEARIWLIVTVILNAVFEKILTSYSLKEDVVNLNPLDLPELVYYRIWLCRKIICCICFIILIVFYYRYKDYNLLNNQLLMEIQQQNMELQMFIKGINVIGNIQKRPKALGSAVQISPTLFVANKEKDMVTTDISGRELTISTVRKSMPKQAPPIVNFENKKKNPLIIVNSVNMKVKPRSQSNGQKKIDRKSRENTPKASQHQENLLSELESPGLQRYNLRRSSRLNSPQSPSYERV